MMDVSALWVHGQVMTCGGETRREEKRGAKQILRSRFNDHGIIYSTKSRQHLLRVGAVFTVAAARSLSNSDTMSQHVHAQRRRI